MVSKIEALRQLSYAPPQEEHQGEWERQVAGTSDRAACLLIVAQLENELDRP